MDYERYRNVFVEPEPSAEEVDAMPGPGPDMSDDPWAGYLADNVELRERFATQRDTARAATEEIMGEL